MARKNCKICGEKGITNLHICQGPKKLTQGEKVVHQDSGVGDEILDSKNFLDERNKEYKDVMGSLKDVIRRNKEFKDVLASLKDVISINPNFQEVIEAYVKVCVEDQIKSSKEILITLLAELEGNGWDDSKSFMETLPLRLQPAEADSTNNLNFMSDWLSQTSFVCDDNEEHINLWAKIIRNLVPTLPSKRKIRQKWPDEQEEKHRRKSTNSGDEPLVTSIPQASAEADLPTSDSVSIENMEETTTEDKRLGKAIEELFEECVKNTKETISSNENMEEISAKEMPVQDNETPDKNDGNGENKTINEDEKLEEAIEEQHEGKPHYDLPCKTVYPVKM